MTEPPICIDCRHMIATRRGHKCGHPTVTARQRNLVTGYRTIAMANCQDERDVAASAYERARCGYSAIYFQPKEQ
jgi:hypothetical protein